MSTFQPADAAPQLPQPQDPWAGAAETELAALPTQPLAAPTSAPAPAPGRPGSSPGQPARPGPDYRPGLAAPSAQPPWQEPYSSQIYPPQRSGKGLVIFLVVVALAVFAGGAGYAIWYANNRLTNPITPTASTRPTGPAVFDPYIAKVGDCFADLSSDPSRTDFRVGACQPGGYKVLKVVLGSSIPKSASGAFDEATSHAVCDGLPYTQVYKSPDTDSTRDTTKDFFMCLSKNT